MQAPWNKARTSTTHWSGFCRKLTFIQSRDKFVDNVLYGSVGPEVVKWLGLVYKNVAGRAPQVRLDVFGNTRPTDWKTGSCRGRG